eukprot:1177282-Prorocentrum_minimum.AAC.1
MLPAARPRKAPSTLSVNGARKHLGTAGSTIRRLVRERRPDIACVLLCLTRLLRSYSLKHNPTRFDTDARLRVRGGYPAAPPRAAGCSAPTPPSSPPPAVRRLPSECRTGPRGAVRIRPRQGRRRCPCTAVPPGARSSWTSRRLGSARPPCDRKTYEDP